MKVSKKDALSWFEFFAQLPEDEDLMPGQMEIALSAFAQIERAVNAHHTELMAQIPHLKTLQGRTYYVGDDSKFPGGCKSCLLGTGLSAVRKTNNCDARCTFCYDYGALNAQPPVGEGMWEIGGTKFFEEDLPLLLSIHQKPTGISYVYLEPFMEIEKYYGTVKIFHEAGIHQHLYTNGIHANRENLKSLAEAGLDEIRFNLGASHCADQVIENMAIAREYFPMVGIETPMTPEFYEEFFRKKEKILAVGLDFINCAELHLNENNIDNYAGENLYFCRQGYISPIFSRNLTLQFMKIADEEAWPLLVHDCSNRTKFARDLNLRAKEGGWFGQSSWGCEFAKIPFAYFLPVLRDESFLFLEEEPMPAGFGMGDIVL